MRLAVRDIIVAPNRWSVDTLKVRELADSIREVGLLDPIIITPDNRLVAGTHRLEACRSLGWTGIECTRYDGNGLQLQFAEIDENLVRNELDAISVGELAIKRDEILESLGFHDRFSSRSPAARVVRLPRFSMPPPEQAAQCRNRAKRVCLGNHRSGNRHRLVDAISLLQSRTTMQECPRRRCRQ